MPGIYHQVRRPPFYAKDYVFFLLNRINQIVNELKDGSLDIPVNSNGDGIFVGSPHSGNPGVPVGLGYNLSGRNGQNTYAGVSHSRNIGIGHGWQTNNGGSHNAYAFYSHLPVRLELASSSNSIGVAKQAADYHKRK